MTLNADLETQVGHVGRILKKDRDEVITEAVRLFCRSVAGGLPRRIGRPPKSGGSDAASVASDSPGSLEGRIVAFVRKHKDVTPRAIWAGVKVDKHVCRRIVAALSDAGVLQVSGSTAARRISMGESGGR